MIPAAERSSFCNSALELAKDGYRVFPIKQGAKKPPMVLSWPEKATTDPNQIKSWWSGEWANCNIGVAAGRGLLVLDVDVKNGKLGQVSLEILDMMGLPESFRVRTPTGGVHVYLNVPSDVHLHNSVGSLQGYPDIDVRGNNGYVVAPHSIVESQQYVPLGGKLLPAPDWLINIVKKGASKQREQSTNEPLIELDLPHSIDKVKHYLIHNAPEAIQGAGGDQTTYEVAARVRDFGVSEEAAFDLMSEFWNEAGKASPPWEPRELETKIQNAYAYATGRPGSASGLAEFDAVDIKDNQPSNPDLAKWSEPIDLWAADSEPPDLKPGLLPDLIERFSKDRGRRLGVEPGVIATLGVTALSSLIHASNVVQVRQKDVKWIERAILWTMLVGDPGSNKSATLKYAIEPVSQIEKQWQREYARKAEVFAEFKAMELDKKAKPSPATSKLKRRRKIINDATTEAVAEILSENEGGLLLVNDELSAFFGGMDAYRVKGKKDRPFWLSAKDGGSFSVDRKNSDLIIVPLNAVSIVGGIQPEKISHLAPSLTDDGLLQRFWPVLLKHLGDGEDLCVDDALDDAITQLAHNMAEAPAGGHYKFSPEADSERINIEHLKKQELARIDCSGAFTEFLNKLPASFARLALALHFIEWYSDELSGRIDDPPPEFIGLDTARRARLFLTEYVIPHARAFYSRHVEQEEAESHARWIAGYILARELKTIDDREIDRSYSALRRAKKRPQRLAAMHELEADGWVEVVRFGPDRKPYEWMINPRVHDGRFQQKALLEKNRRKTVREKIAAEAEHQRHQKKKGLDGQGV